MTKRNHQRHRLLLSQERKEVEKQEAALGKAAARQGGANWKTYIGDKIPRKVYDNLQKAFCTAFQIIFEKGTGVIELGYNRDSLREAQKSRDTAFQEQARKKTLKQASRGASTSNLRNMAITTAEGIGLGLAGIGLPDIVLFVGMVLKGVYEVALGYGYDYTTPGERWFILKTMETAMLRGDDWVRANAQVNMVIAAGGPGPVQEEALPGQIRRTADCFAMDMLVLKFIQGTPVVGLLGGLGNPVYYHKILKYVQLKYRKRYLADLERQYRTPKNSV